MLYRDFIIFSPFLFGEHLKISDVLALAWGQKLGQARPKKARPSQAWSLAWDSFWPGLDFEQAGAGTWTVAWKPGSKTVRDILKLSFNFIFWFCTVENKKIPTYPNTASMSAWVPECDKRQSKASAKVTDAKNISKPGLKSHKAAWDLVESEAQRILTLTSGMSGSICPATTTTISLWQSIATKHKQLATVPEAGFLISRDYY